VAPPTLVGSLISMRVPPLGRVVGGVALPALTFLAALAPAGWVRRLCARRARRQYYRRSYGGTDGWWHDGPRRRARVHRFDDVQRGGGRRCPALPRLGNAARPLHYHRPQVRLRAVDAGASSGAEDRPVQSPGYRAADGGACTSRLTSDGCLRRNAHDAPARRQSNATKEVWRKGRVATTTVEMDSTALKVVRRPTPQLPTGSRSQGPSVDGGHTPLRARA
jgi:hypothetical protein